MAESRGKLYGVSVGPGDPELLTLKAVRVIEEADCIAAPDSGHGRRTALGIIRAHLSGQEIYDCPTPMNADRSEAIAAYHEIAQQLARRLDRGKTVAMITLGDAGIYSTYYYVHEILHARGYDTEVIPGVTSFCAAAARLQIPLCEGSENLLVAPAARSDVSQALDIPATRVFMKAGRELAELKRVLGERGELEGACAVENCGLEGERVYPLLSEADGEQGYFTTVISK